MLMSFRNLRATKRADDMRFWWAASCVIAKGVYTCIISYKLTKRHYHDELVFVLSTPSKPSAGAPAAHVSHHNIWHGEESESNSAQPYRAGSAHAQVQAARRAIEACVQAQASHSRRVRHDQNQLHRPLLAALQRTKPPDNPTT